MSVTSVLHVELPEAEHRSQLRKAVIASTIGTTIEWYDFLLYSTVTGLVFGKLFFPHSDPLVGVLRGVRDLYGRLHRPPDRRGDLRPLRRPHRPQGGADRDAADHRPRDLRGRASSRLTTDRHLGRRHPDRHPLHPGHRRRRRMGRLGAAVDGMGAHQPASRLHHLVAAARRAGRPAAGQRRRAGVQLDLRRPVPGLGLAHPVPAQHRHGGVGLYIRLGILETPAFRRIVAEKRIERAPVARGDQAPAEAGHPVGASRAWPSRRRPTSISPSSSPTARRCCTSRATSC